MRIHDTEIETVNNKHTAGQNFWLSQSHQNVDNVAKLEELGKKNLLQESLIAKMNFDKVEKGNTLANTVT